MVRAVTCQIGRVSEALRRKQDTLNLEEADAKSLETAGNRVGGASSAIPAMAEFTPPANRRSLVMLTEMIPTLPAAEATFDKDSRSVWVHYPRELLNQSRTNPEQFLDRLPEKSQHVPNQGQEGMTGNEGNEENENIAYNPGHSLFQESFFFCTVKKLGDLPATGCIYVETVVDRDFNIAFAKVYSAKNAMNAADILTSRVVPYFEGQGETIKEIHTRKMSEYFGLIPVHPFETFLSTAHIQHLPMEQPGQPSNYLCEQFYRFLLKEFFLPALRRKFQFSLSELQKELDTFVSDYNLMQKKREYEQNSAPPPSANFPVDL
jgi:hypothetical protein